MKPPDINKYNLKSAVIVAKIQKHMEKLKIPS